MITFSAKTDPADHWRWRYRYALRLSEQVDMEEMGVMAIYLIGSTKNATAGPGSDIDLLIHCDGRADHRQRLSDWLDGWSRCLAEINFQLTGVRSEGLLDIHFITDSDIEQKTSFAVMIGSRENSARLLRMKPKTRTR